MAKTPAIRGIVETCVNVSDMNRARRFYEGLFGFAVMEHDERFSAFQVGADVLLLFTAGASDHPMSVNGGVIPPHNTVGAGHFAFAVSRDELETWRQVLADQQIQIESEVRWERGGNSIYFRDPDGNLLELVSPGTWMNY
jgi:catechol 2,3-dioxygenase-like lactoylglutathione lyase family enzyme